MYDIDNNQQETEQKLVESKEPEKQEVLQRKEETDNAYQNLAEVENKVG